MRQAYLALLSCVALAGCNAQANTSASEDPSVWGRVDCVRLAESPTAQQEFDQAKGICLSRGQAAAVAGTANMPGGYGLAGAVAAGINQGVTAGQIGNATVASCMNEQGYIFRPTSEHLAICQAIKEERQRIAGAAKGKPTPPRPARPPIALAAPPAEKQ